MIVQDKLGSWMGVGSGSSEGPFFHIFFCLDSDELTG